jgi:hypothetical protein
VRISTKQKKKNSRTPFWTLKDGFEPEVNEGSNMSLRQSQKWWKKVPEKYLAPEPKIWGTGGPMDPYDRYICMYMYVCTYMLRPN